MPSDSIGWSERPRLLSSRRLESLSDIVFGLAMTLLVSRLPPFETAPTWDDLAKLLDPYLLPMALSFTIAGTYWFNHHRRLALVREPDAPNIILNFVFLFMVMLLPTATGVYGRFGQQGSAGDVVSIYCMLLVILSILHLLLWVSTIQAARRDAYPDLPWRLIIGPSFGAVLFIVLAGIAVWRPAICSDGLFFGFATPLVSRLANRPRGTMAS